MKNSKTYADLGSVLGFLAGLWLWFGMNVAKFGGLVHISAFTLVTDGQIMSANGMPHAGDIHSTVVALMIAFTLLMTTLAGRLLGWFVKK